MDSINRNQPEHNREDLSGAKAVARIRDVVDHTATCFFCTAEDSGSSSARPMSVRKVDEQGRLWFLSSSDSHKNQQVARDPSVRVYFQGSEYADFLTLSGTASITTDKAVIKELWSPFIKTWFTGGVDDPRITALVFEPEEGYYWDNKHGTAIAGIKMLVGAAIGKTLDDSIEGRVMP